ncbi:MAG: gamma-glutamyl-gamma-aminobutyrate hydrolase family protein, partial [Solirubrobacteraceae bacterium]|nr:gamma-glutamyl-gamma-aminobutyrate hydrolase family protein [Patulibacter sp.]
EHRRVPGSLGVENAHQVDVEAGTLTADATQATAGQTTSHSHHHQAVDAVGEGFVVTGRGADDGLVEAIELPSAQFCLGVQWHPEADPDSTVIAALVDAARARIAQQELSA